MNTLSREAGITDLSKFFRELFGLFLIFIAILLSLGLLSFNATDPSFNYVQSGKSEATNLAGLLGAYTAGFLNDVMGVCALIWPAVFAFLGIAHLSCRFFMHWWRWCGLFLLTLCALILASALDISLGDLSGGGMAGGALYQNGLRFLSPAGTFLIWLFLFLTGLQLLLNFSWAGIFTQIYNFISEKFLSRDIKEKIALIQEKLGPVKNYWPEKFPAFISKIRFPSFARLKSLLPAAKEKPITKLDKTPVNQTANEYPDIVILPPEPDWPQAPPKAGNSRLQPNAYGNIGNQEDYSDQNLYNNSDYAPARNLDESISGATLNEKVFNNDLNNPINNCDLSGLASGISQDKPEFPEPEEDFSLADGDGEEFEFSSAPVLAERKPSIEPVIHPLPPTDILLPAPPAAPASVEILRRRGQDLMACFSNFDIQGDLVRVTPGPVITMFEVRPSAGVRVNKIFNLADDLSLALKAVSVRIQPVPGSNTVGIEIPNETREMVNFRELAESAEFQGNSGALPIILGKTISGQPYCADLSKMPHLLVGGSTGAGKSVSLNAMLISLLYRRQPSELKLLLIDPKRVEMSVYADLPHLVHPVVTEMEHAKSALDWAIQEMERRFETIKRLGVRNVASYNQRLESCKGSLPPEFDDLEPIPYLVIVIDELADLMLTARGEVESSILRLLQLARAAAIHLILATQRPSVDVVTGLLKANLSCRVAFQVVSRHDSRTILDQTGAEQLLGKGDMLFKPPAGALRRLHAPFLSDEEIQAVVNYWKEKEAPVFNVDFSRWGSEKSSASSSRDDSGDALYEEAKAFVIEQGRGSISLLQRHLKIGFNRAARIMEQMERDGIITPADGSKPRTVIHN